MLEIIFCTFALIGALDKITGNHLKLGDEFEKGINSLGPLALAMAGMVVISPTLSIALTYIFKPITEFLHMDLSIISIFFANDAGGAVIARELSDSAVWANYHGMVVASMFGAMILLIPMALRLVESKYHEDVLSGLLCGTATIPIGCIISGIMIGCPILGLLWHSLPLIILSAIICVGLIYNPELCRKIFKVVGVILNTLLTIGLALGILHMMTGKLLIPEITPLSDAFGTILYIGVILCGIFPLLSIVSKLFNKIFSKMGKVVNINDSSVFGIITTLANCIPMFDYFPKMDKKGRIMNTAFAVSAAYVFGDHMAFTLALDRTYLAPVIVGKLISGITALVVAHFVYNASQNNGKKEDKVLINN